MRRNYPINLPRSSVKSGVIVFIVIFLLDRITKGLALSKLTHDCAITKWISLRVAYNRGISWGMLDQSSDAMCSIITLVIAFFLVTLLIYMSLRWLDNRLIVGELLVLAGGLSNIIDRLWYGYVVDFIACSFWGWSFPIFNIADCAIVMGVFIMMWMSWHEK